jgi:undecaprenyl-phosphate galactose phosphotransferase
MVPNAAEVLNNLLQNNAEVRAEWEREFKLKDDPRITPIGHFLRRSSLDEIPQLYNVLIGEMSLVGPRPVVAAEIPYYGDKKAHYMSVKPGLTGLWQVSGRNDVSYDERVALDAYYVENQSFWGDIIILFKTVYVVLARKGAY